MELTVNEQSEVVRVVSVQVPAVELRKATRTRIEQMGKRVKIPGFRPGKVPAAELQRRFGAAAQQDALNDTINGAIQRALTQQDLAGTVHVDGVSLQALPAGDEPLRFEFRAERLPRVATLNWEGLAGKRVRVTVDESAVDTEVLALRERHATIEVIEDRAEVAADDIVTVSFRGVGDADIDALQGDDAQIQLGHPQLPAGFTEGLTGATVGTAIEFSITLPDNAGFGALSGEEVQLTATVASIHKRVLPAEDDALGRLEDEFDTLTELRAAIATRLTEQAAKAEQEALRGRMLDVLRKENPIALPPGYLQKTALEEASRQFRTDLSKLDESLVQQLVTMMLPRVERDMQNVVLLSEIARLNSVSVSAEAVNAELSRMAAAQGQPVSRVRAELQKGDGLARVQAGLRLDLALDLVLEKANIEEVDELPADEQPAGEQLVADAPDVVAE